MMMVLVVDRLVAKSENYLGDGLGSSNQTVFLAISSNVPLPPLIMKETIMLIM